MYIPEFTRRTLLPVLALMLCISLLHAQDDAKGSLAAARKARTAAKAVDEGERSAAYAEALALFDDLATRWPDALPERAAATYEAGRLLQKLGRADEALLRYAAVLEVDGQAKRHAQALIASASLKRRRKDVEGAIADLKHLLQICEHEPKYCAEARLDIAAIERKRKRFATATKLADEVLEKHPQLWRQNVDACQMRISILIDCRQWETAKKDLERLDALLAERFKATKSWSSVEKAMRRMSVRRRLTPIPVADQPIEVAAGS